MLGCHHYNDMNIYKNVPPSRPSILSVPSNFSYVTALGGGDSMCVKKK